MIGPEECARAALEGLEQGRRIVIPRRAVRLFAWFGAHAPRSIWLPMCRKLLA
jgi:short-subunit dehydrogenase